MDLNISRVRLNKYTVLIALLRDSKDFCGNWSHFASLSTSDFAGDGIRLQNFRHGEAPEEEREFRILAPVADEVELIRKAEIRLTNRFGSHW